MSRFLLTALISCFFLAGITQEPTIKLKKKDRKRDVLIETTMGEMILRLSDSTPLHRDNFLKLVKERAYDSLLFHRVIPGFMIQGGDPDSRNAEAGKALGQGSRGYMVPAEFRTGLFHKKGALAAARTGDNVNPEKASSSIQFYIVQGKTYTDAGLDSAETFRIRRKIPEQQRTVYKTLGGTPFLDGNYTVFGLLVKGYDVLDRIAGTPTNRSLGDRPTEDVRIIRAKLIRRKKYAEL